MAGYRVEVVHAGYWRGTVDRWTSNYSYNGQASPGIDDAACDLIKGADSNMCWGGGIAANGGIAEVHFYASSGGTPVHSKIYFDWEAPATWVAYTQSGWTGTHTDPVLEGEAALAVSWHGGLSSSGKPVSFRKWYHAVPQTDSHPSNPQVTAPDVASLTSAALLFNAVLASYGLVQGTAAGRLAGSPTVQLWYGNHQRVRGRRRPPLVKANGSAGGVLGDVLSVLGDVGGALLP